MKYSALLKEFGINQSHIAKKMDMGENLLRYHLGKDPIDPKFQKAFIKTIKENTKALTKALNNLPTDAEPAR